MRAVPSWTVGSMSVTDMWCNRRKGRDTQVVTCMTCYCHNMNRPPLVVVVVFVVVDVVVDDDDVCVDFEFELSPIAVTPVTPSYMSSVSVTAGYVSVLPNMVIWH